MTLAWPWLFLLLPLPWLLRRSVAASITDDVLRVPALGPYAPLARSGKALRSRSLTALVIWVLLVLAATRPQSPGDPLPVERTGRDLMLVVDVSVSMANRDLELRGKRLERLAAVKAFGERFLDNRAGDRVGLIVFGSQAYLHTPLSWDVGAVRSALENVEAGLAGDKTALGDALALAAGRLREMPGSRRVIVLLTDGEHNAGQLSAVQGAWVAQREGIAVHALGIGAPAARDEAAPAREALDEDVLRAIARTTGGSYRSAVDADGVEAFFRHINALEPGAQAGQRLRQGRELFPWPLALALFIGLFEAWRRVWRKVERCVAS